MRCQYVKIIRSLSCARPVQRIPFSASKPSKSFSLSERKTFGVQMARGPIIDCIVFFQVYCLAKKPLDTMFISHPTLLYPPSSSLAFF